MPRPTLLTLACLTAPTLAAADAPNVVTDFGPTRSIVASIMDGISAPDVLLSPADDPHHFSMRPSQARQLSNADIVVWVGPTLTPWLADPLTNLADDALTLTLLEVDGWEPLKIRGNHVHGAEEGHDDHDDHDHEDADHDEEHDDHGDEGHDDHDHEDHAEKDHEGHDHGDEDHAEHNHEEHDHDEHAEKDHDDHTGHAHAPGSADPHAWLDPAVVAIWTEAITAALAAKDPDNAEAYRANAAAFQAELTAVGATLDAAFAGIDGDHMILPHDSFQYLEARTGVAPAAFITDSEDADPGPAHLRELRELVETGAVTCVVSGAPKDEQWVEILLENTDAKTALLDVTDRLEVGYIAMMQNLSTALTACND